jgi:hypothetical protein
MKWPLKYSVLGLVLGLTLGLGCTTDVSAPAEVPLAASEGRRDGDGVVGSTHRSGKGGAVLQMPELLACEAQPYAVAEKTVGPDGGSLRIGRHRLEIPRGALTSQVRITGEQVPGSVNSVRLSPEGLRFAKPARLTLDYRNCASVRLLKRVAYTSELLRILEVPPSEDYPKYEYVTGEIDHFSRYAVAY